jgi:hypothetical protein
LCMTVFSYYMVTACSAATEYNSPNVGTIRSPIHRASSSTDYYHVNNTSLSFEHNARLVSHVKSTKKKKRPFTRSTKVMSACNQVFAHLDFLLTSQDILISSWMKMTMRQQQLYHQQQAPQVQRRQ